MNKSSTKYYKITLNDKELLITQKFYIAMYVFKYVREITEYDANIKLIVGFGLKFENSFIMFDYSTKHNKNAEIIKLLMEILDKVKTLC